MERKKLPLNEEPPAEPGSGLAPSALTGRGEWRREKRTEDNNNNKQKTLGRLHSGDTVYSSEVGDTRRKLKKQEDSEKVYLERKEKKGDVSTF